MRYKSSHLAMLATALCCSLLVAMMGAAPVYADTVTLQPDASAGNDTFLNSNAATTPQGSGIHVSVGENNANTAIRRTLIKFDLSSIPANAVVSSAVLSLWVAQDNSDNTRNYDVYRLLRNWTEAGATWNTYDGTNNWTTAGASGGGTDYDDSLNWGTVSLGSAESIGTEKQISLDPFLVENLIDGTWANYGWMIVSRSELNDSYSFYSSDDATGSTRPKLVIEYTVPTATPTNSLTPSITLTPSLTPSITLTPSLTPSITLTPSLTETPTETPVETITPTPTEIYDPGTPGDPEFDFWFRFLTGILLLAGRMYWHGLFFFFILPYLFAYNENVPALIFFLFFAFSIMRFYEWLGDSRKTGL